VRVLSIDGGGIRGIVPALVLADLERRAGRPTADLFDLVAGTSTGGILAAALTLAGPDGRPRYAARDLVGLYEEEGPRIFDRSLAKRVASAEGLLEERYDDGGLRDALRRYLGDARLSAALTDVLITAYDLEERAAFFFRSRRARRSPRHDFTLVDAVRATAAAPSYFEPQLVHDGAGGRHVLVDGGVFATNPAMCAYADVARAGEAVELVASLGTGSLTRPIRLEDARGWGQLEWVRPILDVVFDGVADTVDFQLAQLLPPGGYVRLQTALREASDDLDDVRPANLRALRREAERLLREHAAQLDALAGRLAAPSGA
jgi:uncharacterized protein